MVVISTHGMSGWHPLIFGSIAEHMIKQVNCTLLLLQSDQRIPLPKNRQSKFRRTPLSHKLQIQDTLDRLFREAATSAQRRLDRVADDLAEQGSKTEQRYDQSHSLFTK